MPSVANEMLPASDRLSPNAYTALKPPGGTDSESLAMNEGDEAVPSKAEGTRRNRIGCGLEAIDERIEVLPWRRQTANAHGTVALIFVQVKACSAPPEAR